MRGEFQGVGFTDEEIVVGVHACPDSEEHGA